MSAADPPDPPEQGSGQPPPSRPSPPVPLVLSCILGAVGLVFLLAGGVAGSSTVSVAGVAFGTLSLGAALYWRSLLITAWGEQKRARRAGGAPPARPGGAPPGRE